MNQRHDAWLARCMCAVSLVLTVLGLLFLVTSRFRTGAPVYDYWLVNTGIAIGFSTVGAMITPPPPPQNPIGWLFFPLAPLSVGYRGGGRSGNRLGGSLARDSQRVRPYQSSSRDRGCDRRYQS